jgi:DNA-binding CsgD family transcriptional regulator
MIVASMVRDVDIVRLIGRAYDAVLDPTRWAEVLRDLTASFDTAAGGIHVRTFGRGAARLGCSWFASSGLDPAYEKAYGEHYFAEDPWAACVPDRLEPGVFSRGDELVARRTLARTGFYNDLCVPFGYGDWVGGIALYEPEQCWIAIGMLAPRGRPAFDDEDLAALQLLMPHLNRAFLVSRRVLELEGEQKIAADGLDRATFGVIVLDGAGRVIRTNRVAERILRRGDGLTVKAGVPATTDPSIRGELRGAIRRVLDGTLDGLTGPTLRRAPRRPPARPLALVVAPVQRDEASPFAPRAQCVVYVADPDTRAEPPEDLLRRLFALTPAESRLALLVGQGLTPKEAADELGIRWNTARFQLRQVFAKTATDRQATLVQLLAALGALAEP